MMNKIKVLNLTTILLLFFAFSTFGQNTISDIKTSDVVASEDVDLIITGTFAERRVTGKIVGVYDGDTATLLDSDKTQWKFRFNGIDAPEMKMDFGNKSKQHLSDLIFGKEVTVIYNKVDKYGRFVGKILVGGVDANLEQIKAGMAWHYKKYQDEQTPADQEAYAKAEEEARAAKRGLWSMPNATAPWDWRRGVNNPNLDGVPEGSIIGNTNSRIYHTPGCSSYARVSPKNRQIFKTEQDAIKAGYRISSGCDSTIETSDTSIPVPKDADKVNSSDRKYMVGPRGGCYYLNSSGKKTYVDKKFCGITEGSSDKKAEDNKSSESSNKKSGAGGRTYIKGSRGGCYYLNDSGKKVYVKDKSLCDGQ